MKHKFNVSPVVKQVAGWEASRIPILAPRSERSNIALQL
jgi:hypothetical protein